MNVKSNFSEKKKKKKKKKNKKKKKQKTKKKKKKQGKYLKAQGELLWLFDVRRASCVYQEFIQMTSPPKPVNGF